MEYRKNQCVTVSIEDMSAEGEGIGKPEGYTLFIKGGLVGDKVEAKILKCKKNYGYARVERVIEPSPFRIQPPCPIYNSCGGCQLQALSYEKQLEWKQKKIRNNLIRIGGFREEEIDEVMEPIIGMEVPYRYRNKAQYPLGQDKEGNPITGFYAGRTHSIIPNTDCLLGQEVNKRILETILEHMKQFQIRPYHEEIGSGLVRHILIRNGEISGEIMVCLILNASKAKGGRWIGGQEELLKALSSIEGMTSISVSLNTDKTNVIMGKKIITLWGKPFIQDTLRTRDMQKEGYPSTGEELTFHISPLSFYQVNPSQTEKLYSLALEYAGLEGNETVWDLYCGIGSISLFLAQRAGQVYGVEIIPQAIEDAEKNAQANHISNASFFVGKAEEVLPEKYRKEGIYADVMVVDPPRKGCDSACLETILQMAPRKVVYVSCDSATLARDLKQLCDGGYRIEKVRGVDQFGQTVHVETVALLSKLDVDKHIDVEIKLDELDLTSAESKATYAQIKEYILEKFNLKVSTLYIAQIKKKCGIVLRDNYNKSKKEKQVIPQCTPEKEEAIMDALRHFKMI